MHESIAWLYGLQHFGIKLGLQTIRLLLDEAGAPQRDYRTLHIAGTNGKGSVAAMVDAVAAAHGIRCGLFTSPHLVRPNERIRIAGADIASDELHRGLERWRARIAVMLESGRLDVHPSFFEVVTALALETFRDHDAQLAVLEVGLGGRLDATNAVDADVGAIVGIDLDHTRTLGDTLEKIAEEKAGIVKRGMPVVSGVVQQCAVDVVRRVCRERAAHFIDARAEVQLVTESASGFTLRSPRSLYPDLAPALTGRHQIDNARIAVAAFEQIATKLAVEPSATATREGLAAVRWPGRLQRLDPPDGGAPLLLDGAHNPAGIAALAVHLRRLAHPWMVLLFGMTAGRPARELLEPLAPFVRGAVLTRPPVDRGVDPNAYAAEARSCVPIFALEPDPGAALCRARLEAGAAGLVLATGSLYLVGELLGRFDRDDAPPGPVAM